MTIKKFLLTILVSSTLGMTAHAQVKIGNNPTVINTDAELEIESADKGILLPRLALTSTTSAAPMSAHNAGMVVYNTATVGDVVPGFYYSDGAAWVRLSSGAEDEFVPNPYGLGVMLASQAALGDTLIIEEGLLRTSGSIKLNEFGSGDNNSNVDFYSQEGTRSARVLRGPGENGNFNITNDTGTGRLSVQNPNGGTINFRTTNFSNLVVAADGNVGIGTSTPAAKLDVNGSTRLNGAVSTGNNIELNILGTGNRNSFLDFHSQDSVDNSARIIRAPGENGGFQIENTRGTGEFNIDNQNGGRIRLRTSNNQNLVVAANGNVGIGVINPTNALSVAGSVRAGGGGITNEQGTYTTFNDQYLGGAGIGYAGFLNHRGSGSGGFIFSTAADTASISELMRIEGQTGRVGIGTDTPEAKIDVAGDAYVRGGISNAGVIEVNELSTGDRNSVINFHSQDSVGREARILRGPGEDGNFNITNDTGIGRLTLQNSNGGTINFRTTNFSNLVVAADGNVGIGTSTPEARLDVNGSTRLNGAVSTGNNIELNILGTGNRNSFLDFHSQDSVDNSARILRGPGENGGFDISNVIGTGGINIENRNGGRINLRTTNNQNLVVAANGNVGIGTATPQNALSINGSVRAGGNGIANLQGTYTTFNDSNLGGLSNGFAGFLNHRGSGIGGFVFSTTADSVNIAELMRISSNGNVGIGTITTNEKLVVEGNIKASGNLQSGTTTYPDYVFEAYENGTSELNKDYSFQSLDQIEAFIKVNKHLPGIKSIEELERTEEGYNVDITETSIKTLEKVEELYLHIIEQQNSIETYKAENDALKARLDKIEALMRK